LFFYIQTRWKKKTASFFNTLLDPTPLPPTLVEDNYVPLAPSTPAKEDAPQAPVQHVVSNESISEPPPPAIQDPCVVTSLVVMRVNPRLQQLPFHDRTTSIGLDELWPHPPAKEPLVPYVKQTDTRVVLVAPLLPEHVPFKYVDALNDVSTSPSPPPPPTSSSDNTYRTLPIFAWFLPHMILVLATLAISIMSIVGLLLATSVVFSMKAYVSMIFYNDWLDTQ
jgi:hypothetical protein